MRALLLILTLSMTPVSCGANAPAPLVVTQFGGQGYMSGYLWGQPFHLETWHIGIEDHSGEFVYCSVAHIELSGVIAHGVIDPSMLNVLGLDLDPAPKICTEVYGVLELTVPTYSPPGIPAPPEVDSMTPLD